MGCISECSRNRVSKVCCEFECLLPISTVLPKHTAPETQCFRSLLILNTTGRTVIKWSACESYGVRAATFFLWVRGDTQQPISQAPDIIPFVVSQENSQKSQQCQSGVPTVDEEDAAGDSFQVGV